MLPLAAIFVGEKAKSLAFNYRAIAAEGGQHGIMEDVVEAAAVHVVPSGTAAEQYVAIGQFLHLGLIAEGCRARVYSTKAVPCLAEVVRVDNSVATRPCTESCIDAIVFVTLDDATLAYLAASHKEALHGTEGTLVEEAVNLVGYLLWCAPCASSVMAAKSCHTVGIVAGSFEIGCIAANA